MQTKINIAIMLSGRGSNARKIIESSQDPKYPAHISCIISNSSSAAGNLLAQEYNIPLKVITKKEFGSLDNCDSEIIKQVDALNVDLICLAGFMRVLGSDITKKKTGQIINMHPSLLPKYKGANAQEQALKSGDKISGCTIHYVVAELDSGEIISQATVPIKENDSVETLSDRILEAEHVLYPQTIKCIAGDMLGIRPAILIAKIVSERRNANKQDIINALQQTKCLKHRYTNNWDANTATQRAITEGWIEEDVDTEEYIVGENADQIDEIYRYYY